MLRLKLFCEKGVLLQELLHHLPVEIVDGHSGIDDEALSVDTAGTGAQQKDGGVGGFFGLHGLFAGEDLLSVGGN